VAIVANCAPGASVSLAQREKTIAVLIEMFAMLEVVRQQVVRIGITHMLPTGHRRQGVEWNMAMRTAILKAWCEN